MRESRVNKRWAQGKPVLATVAHFVDPSSAELIGLMGFDCLWIWSTSPWVWPRPPA
jgi:hypothetical protein